MIEKEFKVVALRSSGEGVDLELYPLFKIEAEPVEAKIEEALPPPPERVIVGPARESEEAKIVRQMTKAVVEEYQRIGLLPPTSPTQTMPPLFVPIVHLHLTKNEYEELKPSIGQTITLTVTVKGEFHV
jgi:hypothetical protein